MGMGTKIIDLKNLNHKFVAVLTWAQTAILKPI